MDRNRKHKRWERRLHRWYAVILSAVLLAGQCSIPTSAKESGAVVGVNVDGVGQPEGTENPDAPEKTGEPEGMGSPENPEDPDSTGTPEDPETPDGSGNPGNPEDPDSTGAPEDPEIPDSTGMPEDPEDPDSTGMPEDAEVPDSTGNLEDPETEGNLGGMENPEIPDGIRMLEETRGTAAAAPVTENAEGPLAVGDIFVEDGICYEVSRITPKEVSVKEPEDKDTISGNLIIPETVKGDWTVTCIEDEAFERCTGLEYVEIPDSVSEIKAGAFSRCANLKNVTMPKNMTRIGDQVFCDCVSLTSARVPSGLTYLPWGLFIGCNNLEKVELPDTITEIKWYAFQFCHKLKEIEIPDGVTTIGACAFNECYNLTAIHLPDSVTQMESSVFSKSGLKGAFIIPPRVRGISERVFKGCQDLTEVIIPDSVDHLLNEAFEDCQNLTVLKIAVNPSDQAIGVSGASVFSGCPKNRRLVFMNADGTAELTGDELENAKRIYMAAPDGDTTDRYWYGWRVDQTEPHAVTVQVHKDNVEWPAQEHGRSFALLRNDGAGFVTDLTDVPDGTYRLYDITGISRDSLLPQAAAGTGVKVNGADTGIEVVVKGQDAEAVVDYYTVTFYDGQAAYGAPQSPQVILKDKTASRPDDPGKPGQVFAGWVTEEDGIIPFDFANTQIRDTTGVYASWRMADASNGLIIDTSASESGGTGGSGPDDKDTTASITLYEGSALPVSITEDPSGMPGGSAGNAVVTAGSSDSGSNSEAAYGGSDPEAKDQEPKTGEDWGRVEMYATVAMVAGLIYLLLYFMEPGRGMTEREKEVFVAAFIRWAKRGSRVRRYFALAAIFCLLVYYHSIGRRAQVDWKEAYR